MSAQIRPATHDDLPAMLTIYNHVVLHSTAIYDERPHTLEQRQAWLESRAEQGFPVLVADVEGQVAGYGSYGQFRAWPGYRFTVEHSIYIGEAWQRQGIGRRLLAALIEAARGQSMHAMIASVDAENIPSLRFHEALGFTQVAHFREVGFKFGRWLDLAFLELLLS
jgi:phosphinothricin acetyltransferase